MLPLPRVGGALLAHFLNCIRLTSGLSIYSAQFSPRRATSTTIVWARGEQIARLRNTRRQKLTGIELYWLQAAEKLVALTGIEHDGSRSGESSCV